MFHNVCTLFSHPTLRGRRNGGQADFVWRWCEWVWRHWCDGIGASGSGGIGASGPGDGGMGPGADRWTDGKGKKEKPENDLEVLQKHLHAQLPDYQIEIFRGLSPVKNSFPMMRPRWYAIGLLKQHEDFNVAMRLELDCGDMLVEFLVHVTSCIQFQSHLGLWILRTDIWRQVQAQPPAPYADFLTFIGHARPPQFDNIPVSRIHCHPTLQELQAIARCSCGVDPWAVCDLHPCYCGCRTWLA